MAQTSGFVCRISGWRSTIGGVGAFATFGEALLDECVGVGEAGDLLAGITLAAKIVF